MNIEIEIFELTEALYCFLTLNHEGQGSDKYEALCAIDFTPGILWSEQRVIDGNAYFSEITEDNWLMHRVLRRCRRSLFRCQKGLSRLFKKE